MRRVDVVEAELCTIFGAMYEDRNDTGETWRFSNTPKILRWLASLSIAQYDATISEMLLCHAGFRWLFLLNKANEAELDL